MRILHIVDRVAIRLLNSEIQVEVEGDIDSSRQP